MKNFTGGDRREGGFRGGDRGGKPGFKKSWDNKGGFDRPQVMHKATCSECGKQCEVPFRPDGSKPIFCNDCFNKKRDPSDTRGSRSDFAPKRDFNDRFAPRAESRDFRSDARPAFKSTPDNTGKQLSEISMKLDRLIAAMEKMTAPASAPKAAKEIPDLPAQPGSALIKVSKPKAEKKAVKKKVVAKKKKSLLISSS